MVPKCWGLAKVFSARATSGVYISSFPTSGPSCVIFSPLWAAALMSSSAVSAQGSPLSSNGNVAKPPGTGPPSTPTPSPLWVPGLCCFALLLPYIWGPSWGLSPAFLWEEVHQATCHQDRPVPSLTWERCHLAPGYSAAPSPPPPSWASQPPQPHLKAGQASAFGSCWEQWPFVQPQGRHG